MPRLLDELLDLVLPRRCVGCATPGPGLCSACIRRSCAGTGLRIDQGTVQVWAAAPYAGAVQKAIIRYKERGRRDLAAPLAGLLRRAVRVAVAEAAVGSGRACTAVAPRPVLVCVPSTASAVATRGGDHVLRLARRVAAGSGVPVAAGALVAVRAKQDSAGLSVSGREVNARGAFRAGTRPPGYAALLVDDIVTTGSTLREGCRALHSAGWPVLGAAVIAATPRRRAGPVGTHTSVGLA